MYEKHTFLVAYCTDWPLTKEKALMKSWFSSMYVQTEFLWRRILSMDHNFLTWARSKCVELGTREQCCFAGNSIMRKYHLLITVEVVEMPAIAAGKMISVEVVAKPSSCVACFSIIRGIKYLTSLEIKNQLSLKFLAQFLLKSFEFGEIDSDKV